MILLQPAEHTNRPTLVPYRGVFFILERTLSWLICLSDAIYFFKNYIVQHRLHNTHTHLPL
jgi:hypothetical protein